MSFIVSRARVCALLLLAVQAPFALGQSLEIYAGGGRFVDMPGDTIGLQPGAVAAAPDGYVYVNDINGKLMRVNTATGLVTALPATPGGLSYDIGYSYSIAVDFSGHAYVYSQGALHRIEPDGTLTNVGPISHSGPMAFGPDGTAYLTPGDNRVYAHFPSGEEAAVAGGDEAGFSGDGGPAQEALLNGPQGIAVAANGDIFISDTYNNRIRKISAETGVISTFAGTGADYFNGNGLHATQTNIGHPQGLSFDPAGNLVVASGSAGRILRIDAVSGLVSTIGGGGVGGDGGPAIGASLRPRFVSVDVRGDVYFSDWGTNYQSVRKIDAATGIVTKVIGTNSSYFCGEAVPARYACLYQPYGLDVDLGGNLLLGDIASTRIRVVSAATGYISTFKMTTEAPIGIEHDAAGNIFVASYGNYQVNRYDAVTGAKTVVAGGRGYGFGGDGGPATSASFAAPNDVAIDAAGNLFISDSGNNRVRRVDAATGIITTFASVSSPGALEFDPTGNLVVAETCRIRRIDTATGFVTTIAGTGSCAFQDVPGGAPATSTPIGQNPSFAIDPNGNIFLGWQSAHIYRIDAITGILTRVPAPAAGLATPEGVHIRRASRMEFDASGRLYISQDIFPSNYIFRVSGLIDSTPPAIEPDISGTVGTSGWYLSNVQVGWVVSDAESSVGSTSGCTESSVTDDTAGITFTCTATSIGGTTTRSVTIRRDTTPPAVNFLAASPAATPAGWNNTNVALPFTVSDAHSGVASQSSPSPLTITGEGAGLTGSLTVTDVAGNSATITSPAVNIDRTAPTYTLALPTVSARYGAFSNQTVQFNCNDTLSGVASCSGTLANGTPMPTNTAGNRNFQLWSRTTPATRRGSRSATASRRCSSNASSSAAQIADVQRRDGGQPRADPLAHAGWARRGGSNPARSSRSRVAVSLARARDSAQ